MLEDIRARSKSFKPSTIQSRSVLFTHVCIARQQKPSQHSGPRKLPTSQNLTDFAATTSFFNLPNALTMVV